MRGILVGTWAFMGFGYLEEKRKNTHYMLIIFPYLLSLLFVNFPLSYMAFHVSLFLKTLFDKSLKIHLRIEKDPFVKCRNTKNFCKFYLLCFA